MDLFSSLFLVAMLAYLVVSIFIILCKCINNRAKEIRGIPSVVALSSVHVNAYGGSFEDQRPIQDLNLTNSKAPSISNRDGNKVVHDDSTGGDSGVQKQIQNLNVTKSTLKVVSTSNRAR